MAGRFEVDDQSVVEFQLGNKQLLLLFVGLLVICAIFFFIGLRVGEDTARTKAALVIDENLGETGTGGEPNPASETPRQANALELKAKSTSKPESKVTKPKPARSESKPARQPATETAKAVSQPTTTTAGGGYYLQVASPTDESSAKKLQQELAGKYNDHQTIVQPVTVKGRQHFRVRIGPFSSSENALAFKRSIAPRFKDAIVAKI